MSDIINSLWEPLDDANIHPSPDGVAKEDAPTTVPEVIRAMKGAIKRWYLQSNAIYASTGTGNAYVLTYPQAPEGYAKGVEILFFADKANTGAATLNVNGLGSKAIMNAAGAALTSGQIAAGLVVWLVYDGTAWRMQSPHANPTFSGTVTATTFSGSGASLTNLNASNLSSGTLPNGRLAGDYTFGSLELNGRGYAPIWEAKTPTGTNPEYRLTVNNVRTGALYQEATGAQNLVLRKFNPTTGAGEGYFRIDGPGATDGKYNGATIWTQDNDGAGSGLDADTVDGYQVAGLYRNNAHFTTTGDLTISNGSPSLILTDTTAGSYNTKIVVDANNWYLQKQADNSSTWTTFMQFEMDTTNAYANGSQIWTDAKVTANSITSKLGYTPANGANSIVAGNGLSGGGTYGASRTVTLGTPTSITATSTNLVSATSHTHDFDFSSFIYTGSAMNNTVYPIGTVLHIYASPNFVRNEAMTVCLSTIDDYYYRVLGQNGAGTRLTGTWRARGAGNDGRWLLVQRTA